MRIGASSWRGFAVLAAGATLGLSLAGCSSVESVSKLDPTYGVEVSPRVVAEGEPVPKGGGRYKVGKPYTVAGKTYVPSEDPDYAAEGTASWYGRDFHGRRTANGEVFDMDSISVAHRTLPMPSYVRVTNLANNRSIIARVNNRGPYARGRLVDVSYKTATLLGFAKFGVARVRVEYVGRAPLNGSDDTVLAMTLRQDGSPAQVPNASGVMVASAKPFIPNVPEAVPTSTAEAPLPLSRPYDLGTESETQVAEAEEVAESRGTASRAAATKPTASGSTKPVAAKPVPTHVADASRAPAPVPQPRMVNVAASGWSSGAAPVSGLGFAGVPGRD
ncbi:septal ring lytic transglycosylase RlpA family protein [Xanthobacter sp. V4C-4]|uniref:septal ring lytic transglycosylase RlpA family protein n=1 Tax=Xanthobacter cornucopiae TaxID=3119924 RepID=UPI00372A0B7A